MIAKPPTPAGAEGWFMTPTAAQAAGWSIILTGKDKRPMITSWKPFQSRRPTEAELSTWVKLNPPTWAVVTGAVSGRITLDFDGGAGRQTLSNLGIEPHRSTPSGGYHADFIYPGWKVPTLNAKSKRELGARWPGLDVRGDGGYVIFSGRTDRGEYRWLRDPKPHKLDILPPDLRDFLGLLRAPRPPAPQSNGKSHVMLADGRVKAEHLIRMALDRVGADGRNNVGLWLACQLRDNGYSLADAEAAMQNYRSRCPGTNSKAEEEPYTEKEVQASLREAFSRPPRAPWNPSEQQQLKAKPKSAGCLVEPSPDTDLLHRPCTDTGNAERLVSLYGRNIRFCAETKKWLVWDGRQWNWEDIRSIKVLAKRTMRQMYTPVRIPVQLVQ
jgi:Bifunctional DNA primase/polymerase, N-terminal/D5 N terminal like